MSGRPNITRHGANHAAGGSDPIPGLIGFIRFDFDNQGGYLDIQTNDTDDDGYGFHFNDDTGDNGSLWEVEQSLKLATQDGQVYVLIRDDEGGMTLHSGDQVLIDAASFIIAASTLIDGGNNIATNFADAVNPDDLATLGQITSAIGAAIRFAVANSGTYLDVETTGLDGASYGVRIEETNAGGNGILISSDNANVVLAANGGYAELGGGTCLVRSTNGSGVLAHLGTGETFTIEDSGATPILVTDEATGVTTGTFDGGSP